MTAAVRTLEGISSVLIRDDPRELLREVVLAAAEHLRSDWTMIALRRDAVPELGVHFLAVGPPGRVVDSDGVLPLTLRQELSCAGEPLARDASAGDGRVRIPLELGGEILGRLVGLAPLGPIEHADLWVLQILANQAAMSVHTATLRSVIHALHHETSVAEVMLPDLRRALTARELEVLRLLARGMSNRAIGRALFISETTAKFHVANIMRKLEVTRRAEAVYVASKMGAV